MNKEELIQINKKLREDAELDCQLLNIYCLIERTGYHTVDFGKIRIYLWTVIREYSVEGVGKIKGLILNKHIKYLEKTYPELFEIETYIPFLELKKCIWCKYSTNDSKDRNLECRKYAPKPITTKFQDESYVAKFPAVNKNDWCGEQEIDLEYLKDSYERVHFISSIDALIEVRKGVKHASTN